jgi:GDP-L-fucose synthase
MILVTGGSGLLGYALNNKLKQNNKIFVAPKSKELNLLDCESIKKYFEFNRIDCVFHLAAKVGGVKANTDYVADFYDDNIVMNTNLLKACIENNVQKVVSVLSTCVYPDEPYINYPLTENQLHMGPPHQSNFGYAYAKRMLDVQTRAYRKQHGVNYITVIPNNLFGENDNFDLNNGHVIPALIRKIWEAKITNKPNVEIWGDGKPIREFTYSEDIADILIKVSNQYNDPEPLNIGNTEQYSISYVAEKIKTFLDYQGSFIYDLDKPRGQYQKPSSNKKLLEVTSWKKEDYTDFDISLRKTCDWFKLNYPNVRGLSTTHSTRL